MKRLTMTLVTGLALVAISTGIATARIINIPSDYATIQAGINASSDGDTVLVQPGTYNEKIHFNGHNVVLGSRYLTSADSAFIFSTILTWDSTGSIITLQNSENRDAAIIGFTIQNNGLHHWYGNGISCYNSSPTISSNIIRNIYGSMGGGIYCSGSDPLIKDNLISGCWSYY